MNKIGFMQPNLHRVTHSYPSPVISCIHKAPHAAEVSRITTPSSENRHPKSLVDESTASNVLKDVHISTQLLDGFLDIANDNTSKDLETCGVLGAFLKEGTYYVTTLIIPQQDSTSSSCQAVNEEEIFAIQNEQSLFPVGWIHTHPSQNCFMSSVDLHTQYSYQVMLPEAVAIVMAPTDASRRPFPTFFFIMSVLSRDSIQSRYAMAICSCGSSTVTRTSWTNANPGRRFYSCMKCGFLSWTDPQMCDRAMQIIPGLLRSKNKVEVTLKKKNAEVRTLKVLLCMTWVGIVIFFLYKLT